MNSGESKEPEASKTKNHSSSLYGVEESGVPLRANLCVEGYGSGSEKQSVEARRAREEGGGGGFP